MKTLLAIASGAVIVFLGVPVEGYKYLATPPVKWGSSPPPLPSGGDVNWWMNAGGTPDMDGGPATSDGELTIVTTSMNDWETATAGNLDIEYKGTTTAAVDSADGLNFVYWEETTSPGSGVLAFTEISNSDLLIVDTDVTFNGVNFSWSDPARLRRVALHELGHAWGLAHEESVPTIMHAYEDPSINDLQADDIAGITALYGTGSGGDGVTGVPPPPPPPPPPAPAPEPEPIPRASHPTGGSSPAPTTGGGGGSSSSSQSSYDSGHDYPSGIRGIIARSRHKYCVVATAAFGTQNASRIDALRRLRDRDLRSAGSGRRLIDLYERSAAPVAGSVRRSEVLRALVRGVLPR